MKIEYPTTATAQAAAIRCSLPIRHEDTLDDLGADFPGLSGRTLELTLDLDTLKVRDWPKRTGHVHVKVVDMGAYELLDSAGRHLALLDDCYVPCCMPGEFGDYVVMSIAEDGTIGGWRPTAKKVVESFWPGEY